MVHSVVIPGPFVGANFVILVVGENLEQSSSISKNILDFGFASSRNKDSNATEVENGDRISHFYPVKFRVGMDEITD